jgi:hypothetical protein
VFFQANIPFCQSKFEYPRDSLFDSAFALLQKSFRAKRGASQ